MVRHLPEDRGRGFRLFVPSSPEDEFDQDWGEVEPLLRQAVGHPASVRRVRAALVDPGGLEAREAVGPLRSHDERLPIAATAFRHGPSGGSQVQSSASG